MHSVQVKCVRKTEFSDAFQQCIGRTDAFHPSPDRHHLSVHSRTSINKYWNDVGIKIFKAIRFSLYKYGYTGTSACNRFCSLLIAELRIVGLYS